MKRGHPKDVPPHRSAAEQRLIDLTIIGVLPRCWPQYSYPNPDLPPTFDAVLEATADERLPWEIDIRSLELLDQKHAPKQKCKLR